MEREMDDVEKAVAAAEAKGRREEEAELFKTVREYLLFLYIGMTLVRIAPRLALKCRPAGLPWLPAGYNLLVTCAGRVAGRVLHLVVRPDHIFVSSYLMFDDDYFVRTSSERPAAGVASVANLAMAARTVKRHLA